MEMQKMSGFGIKYCLTGASLGRKGFEANNKDRYFYTLNDEYVTEFLRRSIKGGRRSALNRYLGSSQFEGILNTNNKHLKVYSNEKSNIIDEYLKYVNTESDEFKLEFENSGKGFRKINKNEIDKFLERKLGELEATKELQKIDTNDLLISYGFNSLYPSAQININSIWQKTETEYLRKI